MSHRDSEPGSRIPGDHWLNPQTSKNNPIMSLARLSLYRLKYFLVCTLICCCHGNSINSMNYHVKFDPKKESLLKTFWKSDAKVLRSF